MKQPAELRIQQNCYVWFNNHYPAFRGLFFKVKNEGHNRITGAIDKATGTVPGVSDMILLANKTAYFFEFKTEKGKQSPAQLSWHHLVYKAEYEYHVIRSVESFQNVIKKIIDGNSNNY